MSLFDKAKAALSSQGMIEKAVSAGFDRFDRDRSGAIEKSELLAVLETICGALHLPGMPPAALVDAVFGKCAGADGRITKDKIADLVRSLLHLTAEQGPAVQPSAPISA